ncbi:DUF309 domain-containing protein [Paenibacillus woosongensis]|uniref:DUF309 domain-containing protein n=1 Tax=Paenibacillus woosongensis TaxID=307580 RepID=A0AA95IE54_9BACL|nr:DUF309 domain-containing protein [Paenibacillus woosongensis]WHX50883.1 DUF309 domain-containing protein [Paenibacillus woosongensis]
MTAYDPLYVAFLIYFNRDQDYFECHEVMEELWLKQDKDPLYKGLLQVAVGLYHFRNGNVTGGRKMMESAAQRLTPYPPDSLGINLAKLLDETRAYAAQLAEYEQSPFSYYDLTIEIQDEHLSELVKQALSAVTPNIPQRRGPQRGAKHDLRMQGKSK